MNSIRSSEKALERIRASGSFPASEPQPPRRGAGDWFGSAADDAPSFKLRRERSRTAEISVDDDEGGAGSNRAADGSRAIADERLRELNATGLAALGKGDKARAKQALQDALTAVKRGDIADAGLAAGTYGNYGAMLLATGRDSDQAVDVLTDAVVRITRVPPDLPSKDLERSLQNMQAVLSTALQRDTSDIRLEVISQYAAGAQLERDRKGFECLEHFRIANDLSRTCMGGSHPAHKAISTAFDRAKKAYAAGATTFQSKKDKADSNRSGKIAKNPANANAGEDDFLGGGDGLGLFEKGVSNDVWSALKDAGKGKAKGMRVNAGTAAKTSLADRNQLQSREASRGQSRSGKREPSPDIFASAANSASKKSNFLSNLLGDHVTVDATPASKMPSISLRPGSVSDKNLSKKPVHSAKKQSTGKKDSKSSRRAISPVQQPDFAANGGSSTSRPVAVSAQRANPAPTARGGLKEICVPVPVPRDEIKEVPMARGGQTSMPSKNKSHFAQRDIADEQKSASAASAASTAGDRGPNEQSRSPLTQQVDSEDESADTSCRSPEDHDRSESEAAPGHDSIDDMIGELRIGKLSADSTDRSPTAQQIQDEDVDDAAKFFTEEGKDNTKDAAQGRHIAAADAAAALARDRLAAGDLSAAREAMVVAGREWVAAGMDKTSELAALAGKLAVGLARGRIAVGDVAGAKEAASSAAVEFKKAGENRHSELIAMEVEIGEAAVKAQRMEEAVEVFARAVEMADEIGDAAAQSRAFAKLGNVYELLGRHEDAIKILNKRLALAETNDDHAGQAASYQALGQLCAVLGRSMEACSMFEKSNAISQKTSDVTGQSVSQNGLGSALSSLGRHEEALEKFAQALALAHRAGDVVSIGAAQQGVGRSCTELGRYEEAVEVLKKALETAEHSGDQRVQSMALTTLGQALTSMGRRDEVDDGERTRSTIQHYDEAVQMLSKALELAENTSDIAMQNVACDGLAKAYGALDRHDEAAEMFSRLLTAMQKSADAAGEARALSGLGDACHALGKLDDAAAAHRKCLKIADELGDEKIQAASYAGLANICKGLGRYAEAVQMMERAENIAKKAGVELNLLLRKQWADASAAALTVQCAYRLHVARRAMLAAMEVEFSHNIIVVQAAVRRNLLRAKYAQQLKRKRALLKIECTVVCQSKFRRALANHWWIGVLEGARVGSAHMRGALTCRYKTKKNAAIVLQADVRARLQRSRGSEIMQSERKARGSCTIQGYCRRYQPRVQHCKTVAALTLQAAARRRYSAAAFAASCFVSCISKVARAALCRQNHARHVAATLLYAYMRSVAVLRRWETMDGAALSKTPAEMRALDKQTEEERRRGIEQIQAAARRLLQGKLGHEVMLQSNRVDSCSYLAALCRRRSAHDRHARLLASTYLQAWTRAVLVLKRSHEEKCGAFLRAACRRSIAREAYSRNLAAITAQAAARRKVAGNRKQVKNAAGSRLSRSARAALARRKHVCLRLAAILMEAAARRSLGQTRGRAQMEDSLQQSASSTLQAGCRGAICRIAFCRNAGARWLQAALRRCAARQGRRLADGACRGLGRVLKTVLLRRRYVAEVLAAERLQAVLRRKRGQAEGCAQLAEAREVLHMESLQAVCRRTLVNAVYRKDLSARSLQAFVRRHYACHEKMEQERTASLLGCYLKAASESRRYVVRRSAAKLLQAVLRRCSGQEQGRLHMDAMRRDGCAGALGAFCRRTLAHEGYRQNLASQTVQAAVRCMLRRQRHRKNLALVTIQAALRRQRQGQSKVENEVACDSLRRYVRSVLAVRKHACKRSAATALQACVRRCAGRSAGENCMKEALRGFGAESLQAACRQATACNTYRQSLAARTLQAAACRSKDRHSYCRSAASQTVQAAVRCSQCRGTYAKDLAARFLQAVVCRVLARQQRNAVQHSCDALQRILKAAVAKASFDAQRQGVIRLQAAVRCNRDRASGQGKRFADRIHESMLRPL